LDAHRRGGRRVGHGYRHQPETLAIAKTRDYPRGNVEFAIADAYAPRAIPGDFDCILAGYFLSHVPRDLVVRFLRSAVDRLAAGSRVVLIDNLYVDDSNLPISRTDADGNTYQDRRLDSGQIFEVLKNFYDGDELKSLVRPFAAKIEVERLTYYWLLWFEVA
jgi:hypothetical protein